MCAEGAVVCSKHDPNRAPVGVIAQQETNDPRVILQRLMKSRDASVQLRALEAFLKWEERAARGCPVCERRAEADASVNAFLQALTEEERVHLEFLLDDLETFKARIYEREPALRPIDWRPKLPDEAPPSLAEQPPAPTAGPSPAVPVSVPAPTAVPSSYELPRHLYEEVGLVQMDNGTWTHSLGDDHAAAILDGRVSIESARRAHADNLRAVEHFHRARFEKILTTLREK